MTLLITPSLKNINTNFIQYSHELDNAWWNRVRVTGITANGMLAPNDEIQADGIIPSAPNSSHYVTATAVPSLVNRRVIFSVSIKPGNKNWVLMRLRFTDSTDIYTGDYAQCYFDVGTGNIGVERPWGLATIEAVRMTPEANGFYRCEIIAICTNPLAVQVGCRIYCAEAGVYTFIGDTVTEAIWVWGASFTHKPFYTEPLPTSGDIESEVNDPVMSAATGHRLRDTFGDSDDWGESDLWGRRVVPLNLNIGVS